ncbi:sensor histidine kinase [Arthrobacter castelli]|uniref:sensor histidine kinase n=1 Tax=Arthrobacter castelli TaxID=271431 RepID=UPI00040033FE|nr:HAMP domain-containing sensor histidine kinase [Arthrobacter castelli]
MVAFWRSFSLRAQLITILSLLMVVVVGVTCALTISFLRGFLIEQLDDNLSNNRQAVSNRLFGMTDSQSVELTNYYGALFTPGGEQIIAFESDDAPVLDRPTLAEVKSLSGRARTVPGTADNSDGWRVRIYPLESGEGSVAVALPMEDTAELLGEATERILIGGLLATAVAAGVAYLAVTRAFKPLTRMEKTAAAIAAGDLTQRVRVENPYTEVGRLSKSLNAMLAHIEGAFASRSASEKKMRQFVADASHELRTPLVTIRGFSELHRHGALQTEEDVSTAMVRIENEAKRMGRMVEDLLMLARIDEQRPLEMQPVDLLLLANDAATDAMAGAPDRQIRVISLDGGCPSSAPTAGDEPRLRQVVGNLVANALRYTPEGSPIEIAVGTQRVIDERKDSILQVRDHGPGISEEEAGRVFERFYRADTSRTRETGGSGLGLAIVAAIVAQHDGTVRLDDTEGGGATMWIRLPYVDPPAETGESGESGESDDETAEITEVTDSQSGSVDSER